ncbi:MAG TPA: hypothetical protein VN958_10100 [Chitinophagaceae bacterium]|nr:hypothetical protein [Chitinophagaceae bacterium]
MSYNLVLQSEAIIDIQEAFEWYEKQKEGLGFELNEEIENCLKTKRKSTTLYIH